MKKIFTRKLFVYMVAALVVTIIAVFTLQTVTNRYNNISSSKSKLADAREKLADNEKNIAQLTEALGQNSLAKARAFADMLAAEPKIAGDDARLTEIKDRLMVNEVHIIDQKGIITSSTVPEYVGFDMTSGEQSNAFMVIVDDPSIEIVQEPQANAAEGIIMQYIGVARKDAEGLVQVGVRPEILEEMLASTDISVVLDNLDFGKKGYVYAIEKESGNLLAHSNTDLVGTSAVDAGFPKELTGSGMIKVDGKKGYYYAEEEDGTILGTFLPASEYNSGRRSQTLIVSLSMLVIFGVLLIVINRMVDDKIVRGINNITASTQKIAAGDLELSINEKGNPEFEQLSTSINTMVGSIRQNISENEELLHQQIEDVENNRVLIENVKNACRELGEVTGRTLQNADSIFVGTEKQEQAVLDLKRIMQQLSDELNSSVKASTDVNDSTGAMTDKIVETQSQMAQLQDSMQKISDMSMAIEKIIDEINSIAEQTNLLSLNASIEAARAGETGKGFAVVATQVGELATRSAQAANETNELITNSMRAVKDGQRITEQTVDTFREVVSNIERSRRDMLDISKLVQQNVGIVKQAVNQLGQISDVVEENVHISHDSKTASSEMADITDNLLDMIG